MPKILAVVLFASFLIGCQTGPTSTLTNDLPFEMDAASLVDGRLDSDMIFLVDSVARPVGTSTSIIKRISEKRTKMIELVLIQELRMGTMFDTLWVEESTLRPIRYRNVLAGTQSIQLDYGVDGHITGSFQRDSTSTQIDTTVTELLYDASGFQGIIGALPLASDFEAQVPVFNYLTGKGFASVKVLDSGIMEVNAVMHDVWVVGYSPGGDLVAILSIDKKTGSVLRSETEMGPGWHFVSQAR